MSLIPVINIHPDLLKLICKPGEVGYFCPICSDTLKERKGAYHDFICINVGHTFTAYETSLGTFCYDKFGFFLMINNTKYNITFNFEKKEIGFLTGSIPFTLRIAIL